MVIRPTACHRRVQGPGHGSSAMDNSAPCVTSHWTPSSSSRRIAYLNQTPIKKGKQLSDVATLLPLGTAESGAGSQIFSCIADLVDFYARTVPGAVAVLAPGHAPVTYAELAQRTFGTVAQLRRLGIAATDRVAVVMPRGVEHG